VADNSEHAQKVREDHVSFDQTTFFKFDSRETSFGIDLLEGFLDKRILAREHAFPALIAPIPPSDVHRKRRCQEPSLLLHPAGKVPSSSWKSLP
jgi:hypothetical protein